MYEGVSIGPLNFVSWGFFLFPNLMNLTSLDISDIHVSDIKSWRVVENIKIPNLRSLEARWIPPHTFRRLIQCSSHIFKIIVNYNEENIQVIHQECPRVKNIKFFLF